MRTAIRLLVLALALVSGRFAVDCQAQPQVVLGWNISTNPLTTGYYLVWGTNSGEYFGTNAYTASQTNGTISNLIYGVSYYIAIAASDPFITISPFSPEIVYTPTPPALAEAAGGSSNGPPQPPGLAGPGKPGGPKAPGGNSGQGGMVGGGGTGGGSGGSQGGGSASTTNITQAQIWGVPPMLNLIVSNSQPYLSIGATVGATFAVQSCDATTSNPQLQSSWTTFTNITISNLAPFDTNIPGQAQDAIDIAYVPGLQTIPVPLATNSDVILHRVVMSNDYPILASIVLPPKGYKTRLILVNMPGLSTPDDCCYIGQAGSFIHYNSSNSVLQLEGSGSTIRQIATTLANNLNMDWTTASEFTYSNGVGQILATVVEADPPSSDPVAGTTSTSTININF